MRKNINKTDDPKNDDYNVLRNEALIIQIKLTIKTLKYPIHEMNYIDICISQKEAGKINRKLDKQINKIIHSHKIKKSSKLARSNSPT